MGFTKASGHGRRSAAKRLLLALVLLVAAAALPTPSLAQSAVNCTDAPYNGLIDGDVYPTPPSQITIDGDCTIRDFPAPVRSVPWNSAS